MKTKLLRLIFPIFIFCVLSINLSGQSILDGRIDIRADSNSHNIHFNIHLYVDATMNIQRTYIDLYNSSFYKRIYKSTDSLISPNVRLQIFEGSGLNSDFPSETYFIRDSLVSNSYANLINPQTYTPIKILTVYNEDTSVGWNNNTPICTDDFLNLHRNGNVITKQLNCSNNDGGILKYEIMPTSFSFITGDYSHILPPHTKLEIDSTGLLVWENPPDTGVYLLAIHIKDFVNENIPPQLYSVTWRMITIDVEDATIISSNHEINHNHIAVFPNPTTNYLTIKFDYFTPKDTEIEIFDMVGRRVHAQLIQQQNEQISLSHFADGIYVVRVRSSQQTWTKRVVKQ